MLFGRICGEYQYSVYIRCRADIPWHSISGAAHRSGAGLAEGTTLCQRGPQMALHLQCCPPGKRPLCWEAEMSQTWVSHDSCVIASVLFSFISPLFLCGWIFPPLTKCYCFLFAILLLYIALITHIVLLLYLAYQQVIKIHLLAVVATTDKTSCRLAFSPRKY